jgi:hypothetical protein
VVATDAPGCNGGRGEAEFGKRREFTCSGHSEFSWYVQVETYSA